MKLQTEHLKLYAVTDRSWLGERTLARQVEESLAGGHDGPAAGEGDGP